MRAIYIVLTTVITSLYTSLAFSQEWHNLTAYQKETGYVSLQEGCWLKKDRKRNREVWQQANIFNLSFENANQKYATISQKRDFYLWFDQERKKMGHEVNWIGIAAIAAGQLSKLEVGFIRCFIVGNKEVVQFTNEGSESVFAFAFPLISELYFSNKIIKGEAAKNWSLKYSRMEQCQILEPLYKNLSTKAIQKLNNMAQGKGIYKLGVPKRLRFEGNIEDCETRINHTNNKMLLYYLANQENKDTIQ